MGKGKRIKQMRRPAPDRRTVIVRVCEVGQYDELLTLRVGDENHPPVRIAIPAPMADQLLPLLHTASIDAEETYWQAIPVALQGVDPPDDVAASEAAVRAFLLRQDWAAVLRRVPVDGDATFLVSHAGHVGLAIAEPFTDQRTLAVFDPLQLRRLGPNLLRALATAHANRPPAMNPTIVTTALEFLAAQPWPVGGYPEPTPEQALAYMKDRRRDYLAREPYVRPEENNVPGG